MLLPKRREDSQGDNTFFHYYGVVGYPSSMQDTGKSIVLEAGSRKRECEHERDVKCRKREYEHERDVKCRSWLPYDRGSRCDDRSRIMVCRSKDRGVTIEDRGVSQFYTAIDFLSITAFHSNLSSEECGE